MSGLTLITPTSDRPAAFALCERWMARQTYRGPLQWIVADDGKGAVICSRGQLHLRGKPAADVTTSFRQNLLAGLSAARYDKILFIEDDDWYSPDYLALMSDWLEGADIVGEARARYYNVSTRRWRMMGNKSHACLCQTGIRRSLVQPLIDHIKATDSTFVDMHLWQHVAQGARKLIWPETLHTVGIKGVPGKGGIGLGHRLGPNEKHDADGSQLRRWIGKDADAYAAISPPDSPALKIGVAISTFVNRDDDKLRSRLRQSLESLRASGFPGLIVVVDDGSTDQAHRDYLRGLSGVQVVERPENGGISKTKNTGIKTLLDAGVQFGFLADDDVLFQPDWWLPYVEAHQKTGIDHFSHALRRHAFRDQTFEEQIVNGHAILKTSRLNGVLLTFTPRMIESIGGFKVMPRKWGHEHINFTNRAVTAGFAPFYADVTGDQLIDMIRVPSAISRSDKAQWARDNRRASRDMTLKQPLVL